MSGQTQASLGSLGTSENAINLPSRRLFRGACCLVMCLAWTQWLANGISLSWKSTKGILLIAYITCTTCTCMLIREFIPPLFPLQYDDVFGMDVPVLDGSLWAWCPWLITQQSYGTLGKDSSPWGKGKFKVRKWEAIMEAANILQ